MKSMLFSDENVPLLIASLAFVVICLVFMGVIIHFRGVHYRREMLGKIRSEDNEWSVLEKEGQSLEISSGSGSAFARFLGAIGMKTNPGRSDNKDIKLKFLKAGLQGRNVPTMFWGIKFLLAIALPVVFLMMAVLVFKYFSYYRLLFAAIYLSLVGLFLPDIWLHLKTSGRKERLSKGFADALDLLVVCVEAGMGLDAAISKVGEEIALSHPELSHELSLLNLELRAGKPRQTALKNLANRIDIDEVNSLVTLLTQTDRFGTSVAQALRVFSDSFRTARYQKAEEIAAKIATKLLFPLVLCIFPTLFVVVLGPVAIKIYRVMLSG
jgi:tight adherence protein C